MDSLLVGYFFGLSFGCLLTSGGLDVGRSSYQELSLDHPDLALLLGWWVLTV